MVKSRESEGGNKKPPGPTGPGRFKAPRAVEVLPEVIYDLLSVIEGLLEDGPSAHRITLRDARVKLVRAFPHQFRVSETDLAQMCAEEDGEALEE